MDDNPNVSLPYLTGDLPGIGGTLRAQVDDFVVRELPAYEASGTGEHIFVRIEKRSRTTLEVVDEIAKKLQIRAMDIGVAGMKDRNAVTEQWLSLPPPCTPELADGLDLDGVRVLQVVAHPHKLRTGHLRGNAFVIRITEVDGLARTPDAQAILDLLCAPPGFPNWFGAQRFGHRGANVASGEALIRDPRRRAPGRKKKLLVSAYQAHLFNRYLRARLEEGLFAQVIEGDILAKTDTGGLFQSDDATVDQLRLARGEVVATGPIWGHRMKRADEETAAARRELALLTEVNLVPDSFRPLGKLATGSRRPLAIRPARASISDATCESLTLSFELPSGVYATTFLRELMKTTPDPR